MRRGQEEAPADKKESALHYPSPPRTEFVKKSSLVVVKDGSPTWVEKAKEQFRGREPLFFHFKTQNTQPLVPTCITYDQDLEDANSEDTPFPTQFVYALFDTGSDITVIPASLLPDGVPNVPDLYSACIRFGGTLESLQTCFAVCVILQPLS